MRVMGLESVYPAGANWVGAKEKVPGCRARVSVGLRGREGKACGAAGEMGTNEKVLLLWTSPYCIPHATGICKQCLGTPPTARSSTHARIPRHAPTHTLSGARG